MYIDFSIRSMQFTKFNTLVSYYSFTVVIHVHACIHNQYMVKIYEYLKSGVTC